jgi:hypothetical protein
MICVPAHSPAAVCSSVRLRSLATTLVVACGRNIPATPAANAMPVAGTQLAPIVPTTTIPTVAAAPLTPTPPIVGRTLATVTGTPTLPLIVFVNGSVALGAGVKETENTPSQTIGLLAPVKYDAVNLSTNGLNAWRTEGARALTVVDRLYVANRSKNILVLYAGGGDLISTGSEAEAFARCVTYCQARRSIGFKVVICTFLPRTTYLGTLTPAQFESLRRCPGRCRWQPDDWRGGRSGERDRLPGRWGFPHCRGTPHRR